VQRDAFTRGIIITQRAINQQRDDEVEEPRYKVVLPHDRAGSGSRQTLPTFPSPSRCLRYVYPPHGGYGERSETTLDREGSILLPRVVRKRSCSRYRPRDLETLQPFLFFLRGEGNYRGAEGEKSLNRDTWESRRINGQLLAEAALQLGRGRLTMCRAATHFTETEAIRGARL
jgi:hypothetical protein